MVKRNFMKLLSILVIVLLIAACSNNDKKDNVNETNATPIENNNEVNEANQEAEADLPDYANMPADITIFSLNTNADFEENFGQYLRAQFPQYNFTHISQRDDGMRPPELIVAGVKFDLYIATDMDINERYIPLEAAYDMSELIDKHGVDLNEFDQAYIDAVTFDDKLYALPLDDNRNIMYYNKEIFDRFNVAYPRDDLTWDEALELHNEITRNVDGKQYIGLWTVLKQYVRANQLSLPFVNPETNRAAVNNDGWYTIFDKVFFQFTQDSGIQDRLREKWVGHPDFSVDQVIGMYVYHSDWLTSGLGQLENLDWDIAAMPTFAELPGVGPQPNANNIGITSMSENKDAAMQVVKYLTGKEYQTIMSRKGKITPLLDESIRSEIGKDHVKPDLNWQAVFQNESAPRYSPRTPHDDFVVEAGLYHGAVVPLSRRIIDDVSSALIKAEDEGNLSIEKNTLADLNQ